LPMSIFRGRDPSTGHVPHPRSRAPWEDLAFVFAIAFGAAQTVSSILDATACDHGLFVGVLHLAAADDFQTVLDQLGCTWSDLTGPIYLWLALRAWRGRMTFVSMARWVCVVLILSYTNSVAWVAAEFISNQLRRSITDRISYGSGVLFGLLAPCAFLWIIARPPDKLAHPARLIFCCWLLLSGIGGLVWLLLDAPVLILLLPFDISNGNVDALLTKLSGPVCLLLGIGVLKSRLVRRYAGIVLFLGTFGDLITNGSTAWIGYWSNFTRYDVPIAVLALATIPILKREDLLAIPDSACETCGYDLTGNFSGRCPECGTPVGK